MENSPSSSDAVTQDATGADKGKEVDLTGKTLGDFFIRRRLGQGGMGQVYVAEQISLKREVALKVLRPDLAANFTSLERFKKEAEAIARATHANIVQVYAIGAADGHHFMALEYVEGRNLREFLEKKGSPELLLALSIMRQVAAALHRASELGIIHRDIKPENILINRKGDVKVADFGLSRLTDRTTDITKSDVTMGTPLYMAPEQVERRPLDARTDIYSFGVTCYHMFAGHPPFRGTNPFEVAYQHVKNEPSPLQEIRPDLPADLCLLIHKMMAKKSEDRPQTGREILLAVARLRDTMIGASTSELSGSTFIFGQGSGEVRKALSTQTFPGLSQRRWWNPLLVVVLLLLALGGGLLGSYLYRNVYLARLDASAGRENQSPSVDRENELLKLVQEHTHPETRLDILTGLKYSIELGQFYLRERRLDDAEKYFQKISSHKEYFDVGRLGTAMVLAFRAEPDKSNAKFKEVFLERPPKDKRDKTREELKAFWKNYPSWREMVSRALYHNKTNSPGTFPPELEHWLTPPHPAVKGTTPGQPMP